MTSTDQILGSKAVDTNFTHCAELSHESTVSQAGGGPDEQSIKQKSSDQTPFEIPNFASLELTTVTFA